MILIVLMSNIYLLIPLRLKSCLVLKREFGGLGLNFKETQEKEFLPDCHETENYKEHPTG